VKRPVVFLIGIVAALNVVIVYAADAPATDRAIRLKSPRADDVYSEQRVALVIGNGAYQADPLRNPVNDAEDVAAVLAARKFDVIKITNAGKRAMEEAFETFGERLKKGGTGVFYYSGHGVQVDGVNYLIPVAAEIQTEKDIKYKAVNAGQVLSVMEEAGNRVNIVILDACRDNPYARSFKTMSKGLVKMDAPKGSYIAYATAPGRTAADGDGRNGLYTKWLLGEISKPGQPLEALFKSVRAGVMRETGEKQVPWDATSLIGDFFFTPIDFDDGRMALSEAELKRLRQLEEEQRRADEEKTRVEAAAKAKQSELDREIARLKGQLKVESTSQTLDALAAVADQREQLDAQLREAQRKADEERRNREAAIAQLKAQERANRKTRFEERNAKYAKVIASKFLSDDEKAAAWKAICEEWQVTVSQTKPGQLRWDDASACVIASAGGVLPVGADDDKDFLWDLKAKIENELLGLRLRLHSGKTQVIRTRDGVPFLGFRFRPGLAPRILGETRRRFEKRCRLQVRWVAEARIDVAAMRRSQFSWRQFARYGNAEGLFARYEERGFGRMGSRGVFRSGSARGVLEQQRTGESAVREPEQEQSDESQQQRVSVGGVALSA